MSHSPRSPEKSRFEIIFREIEKCEAPDVDLTIDYRELAEMREVDELRRLAMETTQQVPSSYTRT